MKRCSKTGSWLKVPILVVVFVFLVMNLINLAEAGGMSPERGAESDYRVVFARGNQPLARPWVADLDGSNAAMLADISLTSLPRKLGTPPCGRLIRTCVKTDFTRG